MNQGAGVPVSSSLTATNSILHDNGSILRRDSTETVSNATLQLGSGGGGISVGSGFDLVWNATINGSGSFTKAGGGTLTFPSTASIGYTGSTIISGGSLVDLSASHSSSSASGGSGSAVVTSDTTTDITIDTKNSLPELEID